MNELKSVTFKREITCPKCKGKGYTQDYIPFTYLGDKEDCPKCHGSGTIEKDVTFEIWEDCEHCKDWRKSIKDGSTYYAFVQCPKCKGKNKGRVPHYITPAEWEEKMGERLEAYAPVYYLISACLENDFTQKWVSGDYAEAKDWAKDFDGGSYCCLAIPGQPSPADDWRPE